MPKARKMKQPAIFLDRDGTLIRYVRKPNKASHMRLMKGVPEALRMLHELGFLLIVITNQPMVSRGEITLAGVRKLHAILQKRLEKTGVSIDAFYICPHQYEDHCACRKPKIELIRRATKKYNIDLKRSFFIGDDMRDIEAGRRAKIRTILVKTGNAGKDKRFFDPKPTFVARDLLAGALILSGNSAKK